MKAAEILKSEALDLNRGIVAIDNAISVVKAICEKANKTDGCEVEKFLPDILDNLSDAKTSFSGLASILLSVSAYRIVGGRPEDEEEGEL